MVESYLSHQAGVNEVHRRYSTARYEILTRPDRDERFVDFITDDTGRMRKAVVDMRTGKMKLRPIGEGKRFIDYCPTPTGKMRRMVFNEQTGKVELEPLECRV